MKFSIVTLACLASFAATAYSHADANVLEQRDDTFISAIKLLKTDLGAFLQAVQDFVDVNSYTEVTKTGETTIKNLDKSTGEIEESTTTLSEAGAAEIKLLFEDLTTTAKSLHNEFIAKKPALEKYSRCGASEFYMVDITVGSDDLVRGIDENPDPEDEGLIEGYAEDYISSLELTAIGLGGTECVDA